jgi:uncharacterized iron-regulated membrane protein
VGLWTGALIGFLVLTGLPWAGVTGPLLHRVSGAAGVGYPSSYRQYNIPYSVPAKTALGDAPWTLEDAPMPRSMAPGPTMAGHGHAMMAPDEHAEHREHGPGAPGATRDPAVIRGTDQVARIVSGLGWKSSYRLFLPGGPTGVYTAFTYPDRPQGQQTIYVDRYSLRPIGPEVRFADYGAVGRAVEWGVQVHMGNYFGRANQLLMLTACVGVWLLAISGIAMWWKRRPAGRVGAPPPLSGARVGGLLVSLGIMALLLPLFGASLLVVAALDRAVGRLLGRRATAS